MNRRCSTLSQPVFIFDQQAIRLGLASQEGTEHTVGEDFQEGYIMQE
jgi:hypothetical protein